MTAPNPISASADDPRPAAPGGCSTVSGPMSGGSSHNLAAGAQVPAALFGRGA